MCNNFTKFIDKAIEKYGNRFDYSKVVYTTVESKVDIECKVHGIFKQSPRSHLSSSEPCKGCAKDARASNFIKDATAMHKGKFTYNTAGYQNTASKVVITCPVHGEFLQRAHHHLSGFGCSKCSGKYKPTTSEFIKKAKAVHDNKYTYEKACYNGKDTPLTITCPEHGDFEQSPGSHVNGGRGCPSCADYGFSPG